MCGLVFLREAVLTRHRYLAMNGLWFLRSRKAGWNDVQEVFFLLIASRAYDCALCEGISGYDLSDKFMWDAIVVCIICCPHRKNHVNQTHGCFILYRVIFVLDL